MVAYSPVATDVVRGQIGLRAAILLFLLAFVVLVPGLASLPVTDRDEARFAQASRQMAMTGDYVDIRFQDAPRHKKPAGIYWLQATAVGLSGQGEASEIWVHRLPSLLAAALACAALAWAGAPIVGREGALIAGAMLAALLIVQVEARLAKTDAALLLATILAMGALLRARVLQPSFGIALVFWTAIAAGFLLKGPVILLPVAGAILWLWVTEGTPRWLADLRPLPGFLWAVALAGPWYAMIIAASDGAFLSASLGQDLGSKLVSGQESHGAPPGSYLLAFWLTFWPWTALVPLAAYWVWQNRHTQTVRLLAAWVVPAWVLLELVPTKLLHYPLPLYPALLLIVGAAVAALLQGQLRFERWSAGLGSLVFLAALGVLGGSLVLGPVEMGAGLSVPATVGVGLACAFGILGLVSLWRDAAARGVVALGASGVIMLGTAATYAFPALDRVWIADTMAQITREDYCITGPIAVAGYHEPSTVFRLGTDTLLTDEAGAEAALADGRVAAAWIPVSVASGGAPSIAGFNMSKGQDVRLALRLPAGSSPQPCQEAAS